MRYIPWSAFKTAVDSRTRGLNDLEVMALALGEILDSSQGDRAQQQLDEIIAMVTRTPLIMLMDKSALRKTGPPRGEAYCNVSGTSCWYGLEDICVNCHRKKGWRQLHGRED